MGTRPAESDLIDATRTRLDLSEHELWIASISCGGYESREEFAAFLRGAGPLNDRDYNAVAAALNDKLIEMGLDPSMPYTEDP